MSEPLKDCPFCGGQAKAFGFHVYCEICGVATMIFQTQADAVMAWNRRTEDHELAWMFDDDLPKKPYIVRR